MKLRHGIYFSLMALAFSLAAYADDAEVSKSGYLKGALSIDVFVSDEYGPQGLGVQHSFLQVDYHPKSNLTWNEVKGQSLDLEPTHRWGIRLEGSVKPALFKDYTLEQVRSEVKDRLEKGLTDIIKAQGLAHVVGGPLVHAWANVKSFKIARDLLRRLPLSQGIEERADDIETRFTYQEAIFYYQFDPGQEGAGPDSGLISFPLAFQFGKGPLNPAAPADAQRTYLLENYTATYQEVPRLVSVASTGHVSVMTWADRYGSKHSYEMAALHFREPWLGSAKNIAISATLSEEDYAHDKEWYAIDSGFFRYAYENPDKHTYFNAMVGYYRDELVGSIHYDQRILEKNRDILFVDLAKGRGIPAQYGVSLGWIHEFNREWNADGSPVEKPIWFGGLVLSRTWDRHEIYGFEPYDGEDAETLVTLNGGRLGKDPANRMSVDVQFNDNAEFEGVYAKYSGKMSLTGDQGVFKKAGRVFKKIFRRD